MDNWILHVAKYLKMQVYFVSSVKKQNILAFLSISWHGHSKSILMKSEYSRCISRAIRIFKEHSNNIRNILMTSEVQSKWLNAAKCTSNRVKCIWNAPQLRQLVIFEQQSNRNRTAVKVDSRYSDCIWIPFRMKHTCNVQETFWLYFEADSYNSNEILIPAQIFIFF